MKFNVIGVGVVPGINKLAPVYNVELDKGQVLRILNYRNFRVYGVGIGLVTKKNVNKIFVQKRAPKVPTPTPVTNETLVVEPEKVEVVETPVVEVAPEVDIVDTINDDTTTNETVVEENVTTEAEDEVTADVEEAVAETTTTESNNQPYFNNKKKNKRK